MRDTGQVALRSLAATALTAAAALSGAGCGLGDDEAVTPEPVACTTHEPMVGEPTAPGMVLCVGTTGHVPFTDDRDRHHVVQVTVQAVDMAPRSVVDQLTSEELDIDSDPASVDVYAVRATARLSQPAALNPLRDLLLYSEEHDFADPHVPSTWSPEGCVLKRFTPAMSPGATIRTCDWRAVTRGADLTGVTLGSEIDDYAVYGGNPVSWSLRD